MLAACGAAPRPQPSPCAADRRCTFERRLVLERDAIRVAYGTLRPVEARAQALWQLDGETWRPRDVPGAVVVIAPDAARPRHALLDGLDPGLHFVALVASGQLECHLFLEQQTATCVDVMIEPEPGKVPMCMPDGARNIPDPIALLPDCARGGYVRFDEPAGGDGEAIARLEDGRIMTRVDVVDGRAHGKMVQSFLASGHPYPVETDFVDGKQHGLRRAFDADGRLIDESHWHEGRRHGVTRRLGPAGEILQEWIWEHGRAMEIRAWDLEGNLVAHDDHRPGGLASGTFCDADRHCSQW